MGKRSTARRIAMQALYQAEISGVRIEEALQNIFDQENFIPETKAFAEELAKITWERKKEIDGIIKEYSVGWPVDRIGKVDLAILRLAFAEILSKINPESVVVNEAVELAKKFSSEEAAKFINGILGTYLRKEKDYDKMER